MPLSDSAGACSVGAGPTGGTNAFDLRSALLSAALRTPEPPLGPCRAGTLPLAQAGSEHWDLGSGIWGAGGGRGPGQEGCRALARLREMRPLLAALELTGPSGHLAPCLQACTHRHGAAGVRGTGRGWVGVRQDLDICWGWAGFGGHSSSSWSEQGMSWGWIRAGQGPKLSWTGRSSAPGISCRHPNTDQGSRSRSFS